MLRGPEMIPNRRSGKIFRGANHASIFRGGLGYSIRTSEPQRLILITKGSFVLLRTKVMNLMAHFLSFFAPHCASLGASQHHCPGDGQWVRMACKNMPLAFVIQCHTQKRDFPPRQASLTRIHADVSENQDSPENRILNTINILSTFWIDFFFID